MIQISVPDSPLYGDGAPDELLANLSPVWSCPLGSSVLLKFTNCEFLSAEGAAVLAAFKLRRDALRLGTFLDWSAIPAKVFRQLRRWRIAHLFGDATTTSVETAIPLFHLPQRDPRLLLTYVESRVVNSGKMPS